MYAAGRVRATVRSARVRNAGRGSFRGFVFAMIALAGALWGLFYAVDRAHSSYLAQQAAERAAAFAHAEQLARSYRNGTIVRVERDTNCDQIHFDNKTGAFVSIAPLDCDAWWRQDAIERNKGSNPANSRGFRDVLNSFNR